jgi:Ca-activated chloride channel family protein
LAGIIKFLLALEYIGVFLLFIAASGPVIKISETVWLNRGADILFVLDVSPSMAAIDMDGSNRFNAARRLLKDFAGQRPSDGIGLVAVGDDAALLIPPTTDRDLLASRLENLRIGEMGNGTALGMGIAIAAYHLEKSKAPRRAVVLISDGENNAGAIQPETAAAMLKEINASLWVIGVGSGGEVPIDYVDPYTRMRRSGLIDSHYDRDALTRIAASGGGTWIQAPSADAFAAAFARIDDQELLVRRSSAVTRKHPFHRPFILTALALVAASRFIRRFFLGAWL